MLLERTRRVAGLRGRRGLRGLGEVDYASGDFDWTAYFSDPSWSADASGETQYDSAGDPILRTGSGSAVSVVITPNADGSTTQTATMGDGTTVVSSIAAPVAPSSSIGARAATAAAIAATAAAVGVTAQAVLNGQPFQYAGQTMRYVPGGNVNGQPTYRLQTYAPGTTVAQAQAAAARPAGAISPLMLAAAGLLLFAVVSKR